GERGRVDQGDGRAAAARRRVSRGTFVVGAALHLPFPDASFERLFTSYFYCHLEEAERLRFLREARRVADELVVVGSLWDASVPRARREERVLEDGSRWEVYKRYFEPDALAAELGGGEGLHAGRWLVA